MTGSTLLPTHWPTLDQLKESSKVIPEIDPTAVFALNKLLAAAREIELVFDKDLGRFGLSMSRYALLWTVVNKQGEKGSTPAELAEALGVTRATITSLLDSLEKEGLVTRIRRADDRRKIDIAPSVRAKELLADIYPDHIEQVSKVMSTVSERDRMRFVKLLESIIAAVPVLLEKNEKPKNHPSKRKMREILGVKTSKSSTSKAKAQKSA